MWFFIEFDSNSTEKKFKFGKIRNRAAGKKFKPELLYEYPIKSSAPRKVTQKKHLYSGNRHPCVNINHFLLLHRAMTPKKKSTTVSLHHNSHIIHEK